MLVTTFFVSVFVNGPAEPYIVSTISIESDLQGAATAVRTAPGHPT